MGAGASSGAVQQRRPTTSPNEGKTSLNGTAGTSRSHPKSAVRIYVEYCVLYSAAVVGC